MSRLSHLIHAAKRLDPQLGADLEAEITPLQERLPFGLNFERHRPEAVELPGHQIRKGSKVRILSPRGSAIPGDSRLWSVDSVTDGMASLTERGVAEPESIWHPVDDLATIAEFRDRIYPGLVSTGKVEHGGNKPFHTVINGENFHVLETLLFTHAGKVDAIYIDPPYNTGARDWKYNNDYVAADDLYRHSKWLAFMERRLKLARKLLNPEDSVLIVTIDEHEVHRMRMLLEQTFPEAYLQMVTIVVNPKGVAQGRFARVEEYALYCFFGTAGVSATCDDLLSDSATQRNTRFWKGLLRAGTNAQPSDGAGMAYPIYVDTASSRIVGTGRTLRDRVAAGEVRGDIDAWLPGDTESEAAPQGATVVWPVRRDGSLGVWQAIPETLMALTDGGFTRCVLRPEGWALSYVPNGVRSKIESGEVTVNGRDEITGSANLMMVTDLTRAKTVWKRPRHDAGWHGSVLLRKLLNARLFDFPKSLYAVRDALEPVLASKPSAIVLDFFAGSGTTAHAVALLNRSDGGRRQSILVTNNEVSDAESRRLRAQGKRPGDPDWEARGIFQMVTEPRLRAAFSGLAPGGEQIDLVYEDGEHASGGFEENAEFFTLTYESQFRIAADRAFGSIATMLWLRAGAEGRRIESLDDGWDVAETYGVLRNLDQAAAFVCAVQHAPGVRIVYVITDDERRYQLVASELPERVERVRLYEDYLLNFAIVPDD